nr:unnamed protein product [Digitaria exilis]
MEGEPAEGEELIDDYVHCLMSLDTNARPGQSDGLILGAPVVDGAVGGGTEPDAMRDFASAGDPKEPAVGMTFESDEAAKAFYNEYARRLGFPFRVGRSRRSKGTEEVVIMKRFVCSREGMYKKKQTSPDEATRKRERMSMREGCNAMMEVVRECAEKGAGSEAVYKAAKDILLKAYQEIAAYERNPSRGSQRDDININEDITVDDAMNDQSIPDSGRKVTNLLGQFLDSSWSPV